MNIKRIIREEIDNDLKWIGDVSDKKHLYGVVLLNNDYKLIYINANTIDELWEIYHEKYNKGFDPMLYSIDGKVLKGYSGIEPKADIARKIHEEIEDFDWIRDVDPIDLTKGRWIIKNDKPNSVIQNKQIQEFLYSIGYRWVFGLNICNMIDDPTLYYMDEPYPMDENDKGEKVFDAYGSEVDEIQRLIKNQGFELYDWDTIKQIYYIK
jgi:hypothetical protein